MNCDYEVLKAATAIVVAEGPNDDLMLAAYNYVLRVLKEANDEATARVQAGGGPTEQGEAGQGQRAEEGQAEVPTPIRKGSKLLVQDGLGVVRECEVDTVIEYDGGYFVVHMGEL